jgi:flavin prenyltransferase
MHLGHLRLLVKIAEMGGIVMPPVPAFYQRPATLEDVIDHTLNRALDLLGIELEQDLFERWQGPHCSAKKQIDSLNERLIPASFEN